jgi:hypothetical protein
VWWRGQVWCCTAIIPPAQTWQLRVL